MSKSQTFLIIYVRFADCQEVCLNLLMNSDNNCSFLSKSIAGTGLLKSKQCVKNNKKLDKNTLYNCQTKGFLKRSLLFDTHLVTIAIL